MLSTSFLNQLSKEPFDQFTRWYQDAEQAGVKDPYTFYLATSDLDGKPSVRTLFWRGQNPKGYLFFTNYRSRKGVDLTSNPQGAMLFHWPLLERQVRIEGLVERATKEESDHYWAGRPRESQLNSAASSQSRVIESRETLLQEVQNLSQELNGAPVPRPAHWGGFCLVPNRFEFWQADHFRLHERVEYLKSAEGWKIQILAP